MRADSPARLSDALEAAMVIDERIHDSAVNDAPIVVKVLSSLIAEAEER